MATMNNTLSAPILRDAHLCSLAAGANVSGGSGSSSVFTRALHAARARKMYQRKQLADIGDQQKELVRQMGFDGLLSMRLTKLNKQFGAWILCKLDPSSGNLFAGSKHEICLTCEDVSLLLGIPCGWKQILPAIKNKVKDVKAYMCEIFEKDSFDGITIATIQRILEKKFTRTMTVHEQIVFKTAFIIFVVTKFLAPQSVNSHISIRYMKALVDVENIHKYNWAEFVLHEIKDAAAALQDKIRHRKSIGYINGCIILPQPPSFDLGITQDIEDANMVACTPGHGISKVVEDSEKAQELKAHTPDQAISKLVQASDEAGEDNAVQKTPFSQSGYRQTKLSSFSPHSLLKETGGARIYMREEHDLKALDDLYTYVTSITDEEAVKKIWVHISQPVPMSLSLHDIQQAIWLDTQMQEETFNVAVQVLASYEIHRFGGTYFVGWRHFLNQDFAMFATASDDLWNPKDHLPSFKDDSLIPYDLPSCHLDQGNLRKEFLSNLLSFKKNEAILLDFVTHCLKLSKKI
uniref:Aminotransferase-like plant mobile domain-containing protein n=1 Tax=Oryza glumipatula TaxID=40148 RepID=A0A0D9YSW0_9ORYZ